MTTVDLLIAGAGTAGLACAIEGQRRGLRCALAIPARTPPCVYTGESLSGEGRLHLIRLGLERSVRNALIPETRAFVHWGRPGASVTVHNFEPYGPPCHLDKNVFVAALMTEALSRGCKEFRQPILAIDSNSGQWMVRFAGGTVRSRYLIDATGRHSFIGRRLRARRKRLDRLVASSIVLSDCGMPQRLTEAAANGWWSCTTNPTLGTAIVFFTDNDLRSHLTLEESVRASRFVRHFAPRLQTGERLRPVNVAACSAILSPVAGPNWMAIGDAAMSCDPLSSDGIASAFRTAEWAASSLGIEHGHRQYSAAVLRHFDGYLKERRRTYSEAGLRPEPFWLRRTNGCAA